MGIARRAGLPPGVWVVTAAVLFRAAAAGTAPLIDDEAYYWLWAQRLDWGYLDHPPLIAWLCICGSLPLIWRWKAREVESAPSESGLPRNASLPPLTLNPQPNPSPAS